MFLSHQVFENDLQEYGGGYFLLLFMYRTCIEGSSLAKERKGKGVFEGCVCVCV